MPTYRQPKIARSFVPVSTWLHPLRGLDDAILLGLLRATGAVDPRYSAGRRPLAAEVSTRWVPAHASVIAGNVSSATEAVPESQLDSGTVVVGSGVAAR
jgi:hypothetical protein